MEDAVLQPLGLPTGDSDYVKFQREMLRMLAAPARSYREESIDLARAEFSRAINRALLP